MNRYTPTAKARWVQGPTRATVLIQADVRHHSQANILVFVARNGRDWNYIIPMKRIAPRRNVTIWSACLADYRHSGRLCFNLEGSG